MDTNTENQFVKNRFLPKNFICSVEQCPVTLTTAIIGGRWKPLIIFMISEGVNRFGKMQRTLPSISKKMLTQELRNLEEHGIIHRKVYAEVPPRVEYSLTAWGEAALPILKAMAAWGNQFRHKELQIQEES